MESSRRRRARPRTVIPSPDYAVLLHATSAQEKLWPEHHWVSLGDHLHHRGLHAVLPWGSNGGRNRSESIARAAQARDGAATPYSARSGGPHWSRARGVRRGYRA